MTKHDEIAPVFTPHLHTSEHLEWVGQPAYYKPADEGASRWLFFDLPLPLILALFGGFSLFALGIAFDVFIEGDRRAFFVDGIGGFFTSFPVMALIGVMILVGLITLWYLPGETEDQRRAVLAASYYAVTNERILLASGESTPDVTSVPRGKVDHLEIMPEYGDYATVYFVARDKRTLTKFAHLTADQRSALQDVFNALESIEISG